GRAVLHRVQLADGDPASAGRGYVMEYWLADRPVVKGGVADPEAVVAQRAFVIGGGSLATEVDGDEVHTFTLDGVDYAVATFGAETPSAEQLAGMIAPASER